jgi:hypothetical protein
VFCELCGLQFWPQQSVCGRCGRAPTRQWLQLVSLVTLAVTIACNSLVDVYLLRGLVAGRPHVALFRAWLWFDEKFSLYGWVGVALALLGWSFWLRRASEIQKKEWVARWLLILLLLEGAITMLLPRVPAGSVANIRATLDSHPEAALTLPWGTVALVIGALCMNSETRDSLLGHGKVGSFVSIGLLFLFLVVVLLAWSATFH